MVHLHLDQRWPDVTVHRVARMTDPDALQYVSCMQMTDTGLFVNCKPSPDPEHASKAFNRNLSNNFARNIQCESFSLTAWTLLRTDSFGVSYSQRWATAIGL